MRQYNWLEMGDININDSQTEEYHDPVMEFDYYRDLANHISPANYMEPYIIDKIEIANSLYAELQNAKRNNISELVKIRRKSEQLLGINYDPNIFYLWLLRLYSPEKYLNPYNESQFLNAHRICSLLTESKDEYSNLEDIWMSEREREEREREEREREERERIHLKMEHELEHREEQEERRSIKILIALIGVFLIAAIVGALLS